MEILSYITDVDLIFYFFRIAISARALTPYASNKNNFPGQIELQTLSASISVARPIFR